MGMRLVTVCFCMAVLCILESMVSGGVVMMVSVTDVVGCDGIVMMVSGTGVVGGAGILGAGVVMMVSGGQVLPLP